MGSLIITKCTILTQDVNNKGNCVWSIWEFTAVLSIFLQVQNCDGEFLAVRVLGLCFLC